MLKQREEEHQLASVNRLPNGQTEGQTRTAQVVSAGQSAQKDRPYCILGVTISLSQQKNQINSRLSQTFTDE